ncbi:MAG: EAL domain-containing protein, partial [Methylococcaceae bacterium]|nr:EAL domain-containing protein [Methylococcaceae bacterium]
HFQPVLSLAETPAVLHLEALLRVSGPAGETLPAAVFLPMAERGGLGRELERESVTLILRHLRHDRREARCYAVNLASPSLADPEFLNWLADALHAEPDAAARIVFETSEYGVIGNLDHVRGFLRRIDPLGSRFSLDHFGRGFASFAYLHSLRVDYLKIDGSFIRQIGANRDNQFFVQALTKAAHDLEIKVIAEAVESPDERDTLLRLKLDGIQGYLSGPPSASADTSPGTA